MVGLAGDDDASQGSAGAPRRAARAATLEKAKAVLFISPISPRISRGFGDCLCLVVVVGSLAVAGRGASDYLLTFLFRGATLKTLNYWLALSLNLKACKDLKIYYTLLEELDEA